MTNEAKKFSREQTVQIVAAIRAGIATVKHHKQYTSRVESAIRAEIIKIIPDATVYFGHHDISVWSTKFCDYQHRWYAIWNWTSGGNHWTVDIEPALQREDVSDVIERVAQERELDPQFVILDVRANQLIAELEIVRAAAVKFIADLPVPKAATIRSKSIFWDDPTTDTQAKYPALFPKRY